MELFVVEIIAAPARPRTESLNHMVTAFKVDEAKANRLLERVESGQGPVTVSRPMPERESLRAARGFQAVGFEVRVRAYAERPELGGVSTPVAVAPSVNEGSVNEGYTKPMIPAVSEASSGHESLGRSSQTPSAANLSSTHPTPVPSSEHPAAVSSEDAGFGRPFVPSLPPVMPSVDAGFTVAPTAAPLDYSLNELEAEVTSSISPSDPFNTAPISTDPINTDPINTSADPAPAAAPRATSRRMGLHRKFLIAAILPTLLTVASAIAAILLTVPGALRGLLLESARNPAIALADGVGGLIPSGSLDAKTIGSLQTAMNLSKTTFAAQNVQFVMVTDALGNPVAGWYGQEPTLSAVPSEVRAYVQTQARRATARAYMQANSIPLGTFNPPSRLVDAAGTPLEVVAHQIERDGNTIGTAVVGMSSQAISSRVQSTLITTLLASTLPVLLAIMIAMLLARSITTNVLRLVGAADRISLGQLDQPVALHTNDELNELGEALERMRVSLQESLERLRRRRR
jgi:HAMP domain-containing protein